MSGFHSDDSANRSGRDIELSYPVSAELTRPHMSERLPLEDRTSTLMTFTGGAVSMPFWLFAVEDRAPFQTSLCAAN